MPRYTKLRTYVSNTGASGDKADQLPPPGTLRSSTMMVMRMAMTPSLNASSLPLPMVKPRRGKLESDGTDRKVKMRIELDSLEARVIGCLIEKQVTTPDQYPLSLNALVSACNQKSNRDPVMSVDESTLQRTIDALSRKHLVLERSGFGSRVPKYQQLFCNTEYGSLKFSPQELAVVCELLLRGPETPGELRSRASRMASFTEVAEIEAVLQSLLERE